MQPNQNIQDNTGGVSATNGTFNANNTPEPPKENIMTAGAKKEKSSKGMLLGLILFAVLAIGGIGFGVWAMLDGNTRADSLNTQISTLKTQNSELMEQLGQTSTGDGDTVINIDTDTDIDTADYIYVGEWGLKIKKPTNWKDTVREVTFYNGYPQAVDTLEVRESGMAGAGVMISVGGQSCDTQIAAQYNTCFMVGEKTVIVTELVGELEPGAGSTVSEAFLNNFYDSENYSAI